MTETAGRDERRCHRRIKWDFPARIVVGGRGLPSRVHDISLGGALVDAVGSMRIGDRTVLEVDGIGSFPATVIRVTSTSLALAFEGAGAALAMLIQNRAAQAAGGTTSALGSEGPRQEI